MASESNSDNNVTLRVIILSQGSRTQDDLFLVVPLTTTVQSVKERIQADLSSSPPPATQRLIYEGRALLDGTATLQQILRLDQRPGQGPSSAFVLHLVVRQDSARVSAPQPAPTHIHAPHDAAATPGNLPSPMHMNMPDPQAVVHAAMRNQAHMMQHAIAVQQAQMAAMMGQAQQFGHQPQAETSTSRPEPTNTLNLGHSIPTQSETVDSSRPQNPTLAAPQQPHPHLNNPVPNTNSQSDTHPPTGSVTAPELIGPHLHHVVVQPGLMPLPPRIPTPAAQPSVMFMPMPSQPVPVTQGRQTMAWVINSPAGPQGLVFAPGHGYFSTSSSVASGMMQAQARQLPRPTPTVPGPQPLVESIHRLTRTEAPNTQLARLPQPANQPLGNGPGERPADNAPAAQGVQQIAQAERVDILNLVIQRAWLFVRLYMFIFVLSESGTWRRNIMLATAVFFCILPQQNPLNDAFGAIRRHFDNLIGPPQLGVPNAQPNDNQRRQPQEPRAENTTPQPSGANQPSTPRSPHPMPTPEEAARRLLAQHDQRNPNPVLNALHALERAAVMFLASLIPGVGERHVRAREEARRILDEQDRRRREEADAVAEQPVSTAETKSADAGVLSETPASASAVSEASGTSSSHAAADRTTLRQRNVE